MTGISAIIKLFRSRDPLHTIYTIYTIYTVYLHCTLHDNEGPARTLHNWTGLISIELNMKQASLCIAANCIAAASCGGRGRLGWTSKNCKWKTCRVFCISYNVNRIMSALVTNYFWHYSYYYYVFNIYINLLNIY